MTTIYALRDETGTTRYIGKTGKPLRQRLNQHIAFSRKHNTARCTWIRGMGRTEPRIDAIEIVDGDGCEEEIYWIAKLRGMGWPLLNETNGGQGGDVIEITRAKMSATRKGRKLPREWRMAISAALTGKKLSPEHRAKTIERNKSMIWTPEMRQKIADSNRGRKMTEEHKRKLFAASSKALTGKPLSDETKRKLSATMIGRILSDKHRQKISAGLIGKRKGCTFSVETRKKMSEAAKRRWAK